MPTTSRTIEVRITGEDAGASKTLDKVGGAVTSLGNVALGVAAGGLAALGAGLLGIGAIAFDAALDFDNASKKIQASMGLLPEEAEKFDKIITQVYRDNFGDSMADVGQAVTDVGLKLKTLGIESEGAITSATEDALSLRDAFDVDVNESIEAAAELVRTGLAPNFDSAFDLITTGFQRGLNSSGDFLDSISEYSTQFAELDATGGEFFSALETGLAGGVLGTDKIGDAFKEFRLRILDGSDATSEAVTALEGILGVPAEDFLDGIASGQIRGVDAAQQLVDALSKVEDKEEGLAIGAALFGTQFEDLGDTTLAAVNIMETGMDDLAGATDSLGVQYDTLGSAMEGLKRIGILALKPIGDILLDLAKKALPALESGMEALEPIIANAVSAFESIILTIEAFIGGASGDFPWEDIFPPWLADLMYEVSLAFEPIRDAIKELTKTIFGDLSKGTSSAKDSLKNILGGALKFLADTVFPALTKVIGFVNDHWDEFKGAILGVGAALTGAGIVAIIATIGSVIASLASPILAIIALAALLGAAWAGDWGGIRTIITEAWEGTIKPVLMELWEWLSINVPAAIATLTAFFNDTLLPIFNSVFGSIQETGTGALSALTEFWAEHGESVMLIVATFLNFIWGNIQSVLTSIQNFWDKWGDEIIAIVLIMWRVMQAQFKTALKIIGGIIEAFAALIKGDWSAFGEALKSIWTALWEFHQTIMQAAFDIILVLIDEVIVSINESWAAFIQNIQDLWEAGWHAVAQAVTDAKQAIIDAVNKIIDAIKALFTTDKFKEMGEKIIDGIKDGIEDAKSEVTSKINSIISDIKALFSASAFKALGTNIADGLQQGLADSKQALIDFIKGIAGDMIQAVKDMFGIESPSKVFVGIGENINQGLAMGIASSADLPAQAIQNSASSVVNNTTNIFNQTINGGVPSAGREFEMMRSEAAAFGS